MGVHCWYLHKKYTVYKHMSALLAIKCKDVCYCLQTCNSVVYVVVMGLELGQSLMVRSTTF